MAASIITAVGKLERAIKHPLFLDLLQMEVEARVRCVGSGTAIRDALNSAIEGLADAAPSDMRLSDEEWEAKNLAAMGDH